jgi:hypothetical protein
MKTSESSVGSKFAEALLAKDWVLLESLLDHEIDFRGLTPGRPWEAATAKSLIDTVIYRFRVRNPEDDYVCEQTAYYDELDGKIVKLRILCSGFIPSSSPNGSPIRSTK